MAVFGTRPEIIKLAPVIRESRTRNHEVIILNTAQQAALSKQTLAEFDLKANITLNNESINFRHTEFIALTIDRVSAEIIEQEPDFVLVQGDTNSALVGALSAFYNKVKIVHIEAGLRTPDLHCPFPEEANRRIISMIADFHFAPTTLAVDNLLNAGIDAQIIMNSGNTVVDSLHNFWQKSEKPSDLNVNWADWLNSNPRGLVTIHRKENISKLNEILDTIIEIAKVNKIKFILPVHTNPQISNTVYSKLSQNEQFTLTNSLDYQSLIYTLRNSQIVITDSGGIQEEIATINVPTLIVRESTERSEVLALDNILLAGTSKKSILLAFDQIKYSVFNGGNYMKELINSPFGDGTSSKQILNQIESMLKG